MRQELDEALCAKYPKLFAQRHLPTTQTCMCWGFECGDGWYDLIDRLCGCIQSYIDNNQHKNIQQVVVTQVKEKFGGLRFYYDGGDDLIFGMTWFAQSLSYTICEECGAKGKPNKGGWIRTTCEEHSK